MLGYIYKYKLFRNLPKRKVKISYVEKFARMQIQDDRPVEIYVVAVSEGDWPLGHNNKRRTKVTVNYAVKSSTIGPLVGAWTFVTIRDHIPPFLVTRTSSLASSGGNQLALSSSLRGVRSFFSNFT